MFKILIFFYFFKIVYSDSEEINEKYIDLLPEEEKQEFLNRIARRILEGVQSDDTPNESHVDITDDQLDQHHAYVQDIINQESANLKKKESKEIGRTNENNYVDLSSSGGKREKRKNYEDIKIDTTPEPMYNVIPVKAIYEDYDAISKPNIINTTSTREREREINERHDDTKAEQESQTHNIQENIETQSSNTAVVESLNTNLNKNIELSNIEPTDATSDNADYEITTIATAKNMVSTFVNEIKINEESTENIKQSVGRASLNGENILNLTTLTTEKSIILDTSNAENSQMDIVTDDGSTVLTTDKTIVISTYKRNGKTIFHRSGTDLDQPFNFTNVEEILEVSPTVQTSNASTNLIDTTANNLNENSYSSYTVTTTQNILENNSNDRYDIKSKLREGIVLSKDDSEVAVVMSPNKEYRVYEVAPEQTPFVISKNFTEQEPHAPRQQNYVPIYNFAPENAYFKPDVRFGPVTSYKDSVEHTDIQNRHKPDLVPTNRFFGYSKKYSFQSNGNYENEQLYPFYNILKPKKVKNTNIYYNPYDYLDMEYDVGRLKGLNMRNIRNFDGFPSSDDEAHPINSIHKSDTVKDHVRAVRNLMYIQKVFGPLSEVQRKFDQSSAKFNINLRPVKFKVPIPKNIAVDYYFERMVSDEDYPDSLDVSQRSKPSLEKTKKSKVNFEADYIVNYKDDINRKKFKNFFNSMVTVLKDIIRFDNDALKQYKWLATAVELQVVIRTQLDILNKIKQGDDVDKNQLELFKYGLYLFKISKTEVDDLNKEDLNKKEDVNFVIKGDREERSVLPHNKRKKKIRRPLQLLKDFVYYLRNKDEMKAMNKLSIFYEFKEFLENLLVNLYNLHEAIKNVATITNFETQNWFIDLKHIYLNKASRKNIGEAILHLSLVNLLYKIEDSRSIIERDYKKFIRNHKSEVQIAKEDFVFILLVLDELSKM